METPTLDMKCVIIDHETLWDYGAEPDVGVALLLVPVHVDVAAVRAAWAATHGRPGRYRSTQSARHAAQEFARHLIESHGAAQPAGVVCPTFELEANHK